MSNSPPWRGRYINEADLKNRDGILLFTDFGNVGAYVRADGKLDVACRGDGHVVSTTREQSAALARVYAHHAATGELLKEDTE